MAAAAPHIAPDDVQAGPSRHGGLGRRRPGHGWPVAPSRWSLRTRLLALLMVLLATVSLAIVFVTAVALRGVLLDQLDRRLHDADRRWERVLPGYSGPPLPQLPGGGSGSRSGSVPGSGYGYGYGTRTSWQPRTAAVVPNSTSATSTSATSTVATSTVATSTVATSYGVSGADLVSSFFTGPVEPGTLAAVIDSSSAFGAYIDTTFTPQELTAGQTATVAAVPRDGDTHTRGLGDAGDYRLLSSTLPDGSTVVTGLPMKQVNATLTKMAAIAGAVALAGVAAAALAGTVIVRVTLRPLRRVAATASRVAEIPLDRGEVALSVRVPDVDTDPRTEVGQVGSALNRMLGHIGAALAARHASETRMRQFLADVSHELRTPLAAISGYAELTRRTREPVPPDVTYAMSRVESESARMTALVSDLLLLARLDSGRPLEHEPVDISRMVVDAVSDAHVAAPDHRFALDLPEEPVTVTGDAARLHQVLANLLANARAHTPPGTRVTASLAVTDGEVTVAIVDDGPGIPPDLLPEVFERFARGDSSRSRAAGSTGLGLAIVAAVVEAHHGRVEATSQPGRTAFVVALPRWSAAVCAQGEPPDPATMAPVLTAVPGPTPSTPPTPPAPPAPPAPTAPMAPMAPMAPPAGLAGPMRRA
ncbi:HAMP domain-containing histidine kinase [Frankia sp. AiPs1]|uniref:sensor histidine kinase n=1 Tax=Frankia sp. AiPs1 TaxID=573493 RepID=UPI002043F7A1|nr:HAMP domain-containing sensor histidine kinase [Frankia sp. AiPs1]MCM3925594.1 HAMP domain-containing histidine kinase [Frankia sp. AiPs1]